MKSVQFKFNNISLVQELGQENNFGVTKLVFPVQVVPN